MQENCKHSWLMKKCQAGSCFGEVVTGGVKLSNTQPVKFNFQGKCNSFDLLGKWNIVQLFL